MPIPAHCSIQGNGSANLNWCGGVAVCLSVPILLYRFPSRKTRLTQWDNRFLEFLPAGQKLPEYLELTGYKNPEDTLFAPLQYTNNIKQDGFSWLCESPATLTRFNAFMEGRRADRAYWADWFPIQDHILTGADKGSDGTLLVDIGGGRGHDLLVSSNGSPRHQAKLILEDLPKIVDEAETALDLEGNGIDAVGYDFLAQEQSVKGEFPICRLM
jgi:hypothetical protein